MDSQLEPIYRRVTEAVNPEAVFGGAPLVLPPSLLLEDLDRRYQDIASELTPKRFSMPDDIEAARTALEALNQLRDEARGRIEAGIYGMNGFGMALPAHAGRSISVGANTYFIGSKLSESSRFTFHEAFLQRDGHTCGEVLIKLAASSEFNPLVQVETRILGLLHSQQVPQWKHLPLVMDQFVAGDRKGIVLRRQPALSLEEVRSRVSHEDGVDQRHMVWMLDRLLSMLGYVHRQGVVNGTISPSTVVVQADSHNAIVTDWTNAVHRPAVSGERVQEYFEHFSAPEVRDAGRIGPWSDIYSVGKLMIWVLGGNVETNEMPDLVEPAIQEFLRDMVRENLHARPDDAWKLHEAQNVLKDSLWERKFIPFVV